MSYAYGTVTIAHIDTNNNTHLTAQTVAASSNYDRFSIGDFCEMVINLTATNDDFLSKRIVFNPLLFGSTGSVSDSSGFIVETQSYIVPVAVNMNFTATDANNQNYSASFQVNSATSATIRFRFYVTSQILSFIPHIVDNAMRFGNMINDGFAKTQFQKENSVFTQVSNCKLYVSVAPQNDVNNAEIVQSSSNYTFDFAANVRWYDRNTDYSHGNRFLNIARNTLQSSGNEIAFMQWNGSISDNISNDFDTNTLMLSTYDDNRLVFALYGQSNGTFGTVTSAKAMLVKVSNLSNQTDFVNDCNLIELDNITTVVTGSNSASVAFTVDKSLLQFGETYHIIVNTYDSSNGFSTAHILPNLVADALPLIQPTIDGKITTYHKELENVAVNVAPNERFKTSIRVDKTSFNNAMLQNGLNQDFDETFKSVQLQLSDTNAVLNGDNIAKWTTQTGLLYGDLSSNDQTDHIEFATEIVAPNENVTKRLVWTITFYITTPNGQVEPYNIIYQQHINIQAETITALTNVKLYEVENYPTTRTEVFDLCGLDRVVVEFEKAGALLDESTEFAPVLFSDAQRFENTINITDMLLTPKNNRLLTVLDTFDNDNLAAFTIDLTAIYNDTDYTIGILATRHFTSFCPVVNNVNANYRIMRDSSYIYVYADIVNAVNALDAAAEPNTLRIISHEITNTATNDQTGLQPMIYPNPNTLNYVYIRIPVTSQYRSVDYAAIIESEHSDGNDTHLIQHKVDIKNIVLPKVAQGWVNYVGSFDCLDLG